MRREIKLRAWDKIKKRMIKPSGHYGSILHWRIESANNGHWGMFERKRICGDADGSGILMQYTGLKDKDGKEIYEGDIVKRTSMAPGGIDFTGEVVFAECQYWIEKNSNGFSLFSEIDELEVVGNIYENPELLEG